MTQNNFEYIYIFKGLYNTKNNTQPVYQRVEFFFNLLLHSPSNQCQTFFFFPKRFKTLQTSKKDAASMAVWRAVEEKFYSYVTPFKRL